MKEKKRIEFLPPHNTLGNMIPRSAQVGDCFNCTDLLVRWRRQTMQWTPWFHIKRPISGCRSMDEANYMEDHPSVTYIDISRIVHTGKFK